MQPESALPMTRDVLVVSPSESLHAAWSIMSRERIRHLPVVRAGALLGMLSDRDVLRRGTLDAQGDFHVPRDVRVIDAMTPTPLETCEFDARVSDVADRMIDGKIDAVPVVRGLRLVGLVTSTDLLSLLVEREEAQILPFHFRLVENGEDYLA
ncbi:MAG: CBS domain-containing protein [Polyangiaceae bacterium]